MDEAGGLLSSLSLTCFMSVLEQFLGEPSPAQLLTCVCFLLIWRVALWNRKRYLSETLTSSSSPASRDQLIGFSIILIKKNAIFFFFYQLMGSWKQK